MERGYTLQDGTSAGLLALGTYSVKTSWGGGGGRPGGCGTT